MLRIDALPAGNGDALWIEYGRADRPHRMLIDGGTELSWETGLRTRIEALDRDERHFELLVVTHIDADHIDGALALLQDDTLGVTFGEVWFNGWRHLPDTPLESLGPVAGEQLTDTIVARQLRWNAAFDGRAVAVRDRDAPPTKKFAAELKLTVLSPTAAQLAALKPVWREAVEAAGLDPEKPRVETPEADAPAGLEVLGAATPNVTTLVDLPFKQDTKEPNGSSIVLLLEHDGARALLTGDCFPSVVATSLARLGASENDPIDVDLVKVPHHGSRSNVSLPLLRMLDCARFVFSSNGSKTKHPHPEAVARVIAAAPPGAELLFNYRTTFNEIWDDDALRDEHEYRTSYAAAGEPATVEL
jgi:hypothetical protein